MGRPPKTCAFAKLALGQQLFRARSRNWCPARDTTFTPQAHRRSPRVLTPLRIYQSGLEIDLPRHRKGVIDLDAEVSNGALKFPVPEAKLANLQAARSSAVSS